MMHLLRLRIKSSNRKHGRAYAGVEPAAFADSLAEVHEDFSQFTFVDLGSGKGRAIIMAAQLGFAELIGVEFSEHLAKIARANLTKLHVTNATILLQDAAEYKFPEKPLLVFLFNPFGPDILRKVLQNLKRHTQPLYLVYCNPLEEEEIRNAGFLVPLKTGKPHAVWMRPNTAKASKGAGVRLSKASQMHDLSLS
jgi:SAM-dependent methyltransferase